MKKVTFYFLMILIIGLGVTLPSMAWTVAPVRFEVEGERAKEYTFAFSVLNESQLYEKRFEVQTDDWIIDKDNNFLRKAFNKEVENNYSSSSWIKVTPQNFVVPPGETKKIRFTVSIPENLPGDGEYSAGIFVGEKNIEKPPAGEKIIHIKQDTYIGVVVYVKVGDEKPSVTLKDLKVDLKITEEGNHVVLLPSYENSGNVHTRANLTVKMESASGDEKTKEFQAGELVVLRNSEVAFPITIPESLPKGSEWNFIISADFGKSNPVLVGRKIYKIPDISTVDKKASKY